MAPLRFILLFAVHCSLFTAKADGVKFFHGSWSQVMAEAKRQNKPIFVDVYTTWCGPCKLMSAKAFPDARVGAKMNAGFINYKIDAERGEGETLARRYGVQAFPTSLFIGSDGRLIRRTVGYNGIDSFLAEAQRALSDATASNAMAVWYKRFDAGERSPEFLRGMLQKQLEYDRPSADVLDAYVQTLPQGKTDTLSNEQLEFLCKTLSTTFTKAYPLLAKQSTQVMLHPAKRHLTMDLIKAQRRAEENDFKDAVATQDELVLEGLIKNVTAKKLALNPLVATPSPEQKAQFDRDADDTRLRFYKASRLPNHYIALAKKIAETRLMTKTDAELDSLDRLVGQRMKPMMAMMNSLFKDSTMQQANKIMADTTRDMSQVMSKATAAQLRDLVDGLCGQTTNKADLTQALRWSERATQLDPAPLNLITQARLLTKLGRKPDARTCLQKGIAQQAKEADKAWLQVELKKLP
jgi:thiol-disulfide isomerase/thioredoxin